MEAKSITIRLTNEDVDRIKRIKSANGFKTDASAIRYALLKYANVLAKREKENRNDE